MVQKLFTELRTLYSLNWGKCNVIRIRVRMRDLVEQDALRYAVDMAMKRYPYFCVELKHDGEYCFVSNERPVVMTNSLTGVNLNTAESNYDSPVKRVSAQNISQNPEHSGIKKPRL